MLGLLGVRRLSPTKSQRRAQRKALGEQTVFEALGGRAKGVTPKSASRYTRVSTATDYRTEVETIPGHWDREQNWPYNDFYVEPKKTVTKIPIGTKIILRRSSRRGGGGSTSSRGEGQAVRGTMKAKKSRAKKQARFGGTKGGIPPRQKKGKHA